MSKDSPADPFEKVRAVFGDTVEVKQVRPEKSEEETDGVIGDLLTQVCYHYPQYKLEDAEKLTHSQVVALLTQVEKQRAIEWYNLTLISAAPHTKKGKLVDKLLKQYKRIVDS